MELGRGGEFKNGTWSIYFARLNGKFLLKL
jgi:hypothetical protein